MKPKVLHHMISYALSLIMILIIIRARVLGIDGELSIFFFKPLAKIILASLYDIYYVLGLSALFLLLLYTFRSNQHTYKLIKNTFIVLCILSIFINLANVRLVQMLGVPLNYRWLYYSDLLGNTEALPIILENLTPTFIIYFLILCGLFWGIARVLYALLYRVSQYQIVGKRLYWGIAVMAFVYCFTAQLYLNYKQVSYAKLANPVVYLVTSILNSDTSNTDLFTLDINNAAYAADLKPSFKKNTYYSPSHDQLKNVIFFVLESVSSQYVSGYTDKYDVTPVIKQHLNQSLLFSDIYAHSPSTNNNLVSLLGSLYPMISYKSITAEHPYMRWPSISAELKKYHYRTAFFSASDNRFQDMDKYLSARQFDTVIDYRSIACTEDIFTSEWNNLNGVDEACMIDAFTDWLVADSIQQPFFATLWTMQTHYPYFTSGKEVDYGVQDPLFNRYLNALHHSDAMLGRLLATLKEKGLSESTLVVVLGDHGEAFLQHHHYGHASHLYEENIKVPLILINPLLFKGEHKTRIGGLIDIGPTLMDMLRLPVPQEWQGFSLFDTDRPNSTFFFSPWSDYLFGYRDGVYKVIFNATTGQTMVFNVHDDPEEKNDLAPKMPEFVSQSHLKLAGWVQGYTSILNKNLQHHEGHVPVPSSSAQ